MLATLAGRKNLIADPRRDIGAVTGQSNRIDHRLLSELLADNRLDIDSGGDITLKRHHVCRARLTVLIGTGKTIQTSDEVRRLGVLGVRTVLGHLLTGGVRITTTLVSRRLAAFQIQTLDRLIHLDSHGRLLSSAGHILCVT